MVNHEIDFDESRGGPRHPFNYISSPPNGELRKATQKIFKWEPSGAHDPGRVKLPSVHIEAMFRRAPVADPSALSSHLHVEKCLGMREAQGT